MSANEKLPAKTRSRTRNIGLGCASIIGLALLCGLAASLINTGDDNDDDVAAEPDQTPTAKPTSTSVSEDPVITDTHVDQTVAFMLDEPGVSDITISVEDETVTVAVIVDAAIDEARSQEILDSAVRWLASQAAQSSDVSSPSGDNLGGIWDHYTLQVGAGPSPDTFYARGAKVPSSPVISWD